MGGGIASAGLIKQSCVYMGPEKSGVLRRLNVYEDWQPLSYPSHDIEWILCQLGRKRHIDRNESF